MSHRAQLISSRIQYLIILTTARPIDWNKRYWLASTCYGRRGPLLCSEPNNNIGRNLTHISDGTPNVRSVITSTSTTCSKRRNIIQSVICQENVEQKMSSYLIKRTWSNTVQLYEDEIVNTVSIDRMGIVKCKKHWRRMTTMPMLEPTRSTMRMTAFDPTRNFKNVLQVQLEKSHKGEGIGSMQAI